jgi:hypothetical protein
MKTYPDTPVYMIYYAPGTSGRFLVYLISLFLGNKTIQEFSNFGNAHVPNSYFMNRTLPYDLIGSRHQPNTSRFPDPRDITKPIIFQSHKEHMDVNSLLDKYPLSKILLIQYSIEELELVEMNLFYKVFIDSWGSWPGIREHWEGVKHYFNTDELPSTIPSDKVLLGIKSKIKDISTISYPYGEDSEIDDSRIVTYKFKDILRDKQKTLEMLSDLTSSPIPSIIEENKIYDNYISSQKPIWDILGITY